MIEWRHQTGIMQTISPYLQSSICWLEYKKCGVFFEFTPSQRTNISVILFPYKMTVIKYRLIILKF